MLKVINMCYIYQMDNVLKIEVLLNILNTVFAKAVYLKDDKAIEKLTALKHTIYYTDFDYAEVNNMLNEIDLNLKDHE